MVSARSVNCQYLTLNQLLCAVKQSEKKNSSIETDHFWKTYYNECHGTFKIEIIYTAIYFTYIASAEHETDFRWQPTNSIN